MATDKQVLNSGRHLIVSDNANGARLKLLTCLILVATSTRLIPHPWNTTAIGAVAVFAGSRLADFRFAFLLSIVPSLLLDLVRQGPHTLLPFVYVGMTLCVLLGRCIRLRRSLFWAALATFVGSVQFCIVTLIGCWLFFYPRSVEGLLICCYLGLPYVQKTLLIDAAFATVLFVGWTLGEVVFLSEQEPKVEPAAA